MNATTLASLERRLRPILTRLSPAITVKLYSRGRLEFLKKLHEDTSSEVYTPPADIHKILWGIHFRTPLMNAAGMFKNGECYKLVASQGAGAYLGGTGTWNSRVGNQKNGIYLPFTPYPKSHAASNWLGLPNDGDVVNSTRASKLQRTYGTPIGWSVMGSPDLQGQEKLDSLVAGMNLYAKAGVDFLEMNESCPNTAHGKPQDDDLAKRLNYVQNKFLSQRTRKLPTIVKFSNDTSVSQIPIILDLLFEKGFDGVNFGNTSTNYQQRRSKIDPLEHKLFDYYTKTFGGGISGKPLRESSLELAARAVEYHRAGPPSQEFHVIRTGGIETPQDIEESARAGIPLNQWFTGYFENLAQHGDSLYRKILS